ncbi:MAG: histidine kinase [Actinomycetota bacterium]
MTAGGPSSAPQQWAGGDAELVLKALSQAVEAIATEPSIDTVLATLVGAARELAGARYAALGIPEKESDAFARFIHVGMTDELVESMGDLPRTHGLLDAMLTDPRPYRTVDITRDPRFRGWWPITHPRMRSFLGVPIVYKGDVIGAFYLTDKVGRPEFDQADEDRIKLLSAHAAIAIENARLVEDSYELALVEERNRLARELHDALNQSLFSLSLSAGAAASLLPGDVAGAARELEEVRRLARSTMGELREIVAGLRPPDLDRDGLTISLRNQTEVAGRASGLAASFQAMGEPTLDRDEELQLYRIAQEAITNALRHAQANAISLRLEFAGDKFRLVMSDDGIGFDPEAPGLRSRRLGLTAMRERAARLRARLTIESSKRGTTITVERDHG